MALSYPYSLAFFSDTMRVKNVTLALRRFDEMSGSGDGRFWASELSRPLWSAVIDLADGTALLARQLEAKIDGLDGTNGTFLFADQSYPGPAYGTTGLGAVTVSAIAADRSRVALTGLPAGFQITAGDRFSIAYGSGHYYLGRFSENATADSGGTISSRDVRPYLPFGVDTGDTVELVKPRFKAIIPPGGFDGFEYDLPNGLNAFGGKLQILQKP